MEPFFKIKFLNLNKEAKSPDWLATGCHGKQIKNRAPLIPPEYSHLPTPNYETNTTFRF